VIQSKTCTWAVANFKKNTGPQWALKTWAWWSHVTGQWIPCFDRCQLNITWMLNITDVRCKPALLIFQGKTPWMRLLQSVTFYIDLHEVAYRRIDGQSHDNQNLLVWWVTKFSKQRASAHDQELCYQTNAQSLVNKLWLFYGFFSCSQGCTLEK